MNTQVAVLALMLGLISLEKSWASANRPVQDADPEMRSTVAIHHDTRIPGAKAGGCTGTLISADIVVTAAHCVVKILSVSPLKLSKEPDVNQNLLVTFGNGSEQEPVPVNRVRRVRGIIVHSEFNNERIEGKPIHDLALIRLESFAPRGFEPAFILGPRHPLVAGMPIVVAGFGSNLPGSQLSSFETVILNHQFANVGAIGIRVGANETEGTIFKGYSGGPAYFRMRDHLAVWGVCNGGWQGMMTYQNLPFYLEWMRQSIFKMGGNMKLRVIP